MKKTSVVFNRHTLERAKLRMKLTPCELSIILQTKRYVCIHVEDRKKIEHRLFWSPIDKKYYIAIADIRENYLGERCSIITVTKGPLHDEYFTKEKKVLIDRNIMERARELFEGWEFEYYSIKREVKFQKKLERSSKEEKDRVHELKQQHISISRQRVLVSKKNSDAKKRIQKGESKPHFFFSASVIRFSGEDHKNYCEPYRISLSPRAQDGGSIVDLFTEQWILKTVGEELKSLLLPYEAVLSVYVSEDNNIPISIPLELLQ